MTYKQRSWRCSNQALSVLVVFLSISIQAMDQDPSNYSSSSSSSSNSSSPLSQEIPQSSYPESFPPREPHFHNVPIRILESVFNSAPESIKNIVEHLKDPNFLEEDEYRSAFFVGVPGTAKSTLAKAIAYKAQFELILLPATSFLGGQRNEAAARLRDKLNEIVSINAKQLVVIDECNRLGEHYDSSHHDADSLSEALWTFLDEQRGNHNFFLIGTMNRADRLPEPLKSRMIPQYFELTLIHNPLEKQRIFKERLISPLTQLHDEVTPEYLESICKFLPPCSNRDLSGLVLIVKDAYRIHDKTGSLKIIRKKHIDMALCRFKDNCKSIKLGQVHENEEERRHKDLIEMHEAHFVQQQKIQIVLHNSKQVTHNTYGTTFSSGHPVLVMAETEQYVPGNKKAEALSYITDEQMDIYKKRMEKTLLRRMQEEKPREESSQQSTCIIS